MAKAAPAANAPAATKRDRVDRERDGKRGGKPENGAGPAPGRPPGQGPGAGRGKRDDANRGQGPDAGRGKGPDAGRSKGPDAGRGKAPEAGRSKGPGAGRSKGDDRERPEGRTKAAPQPAPRKLSGAGPAPAPAPVAQAAAAPAAPAPAAASPAAAQTTAAPAAAESTAAAPTAAVPADPAATPGDPALVQQRTPAASTAPGATGAAPAGAPAPGTAPGSTAAGPILPLGPDALDAGLLPSAAAALITPGDGEDADAGAGNDLVARAEEGTTSGAGSGDGRPRRFVVTETVQDIVEVVPGPVRAALVALAALSLLLGAASLAAGLRSRSLARQRAELLQDIGLLQSALLPAIPARLGSLRASVAYRPADGPGAGGDFYDAFELAEGRIGLIVGDVSGHGRQALAKTTLVRYTVRAYLEAGLQPRQALAMANRALEGQLEPDFATAIAAVHDPAAGVLTCASAGHPAPIVLGDGVAGVIDGPCAPPLGAGFVTGQRQTVLPMPAGALACLHTDGLTEARLAGGELLGTERLTGWLRELGPTASARELLDLVVARAARVPDDLAACLVRAHPAATAPAHRVEQLKLDVLDLEAPPLNRFLEACGVPFAQWASVGAHADELLARAGGAVVEVRLGDGEPVASVVALGDESYVGPPGPVAPDRARLAR